MRKLILITSIILLMLVSGCTQLEPNKKYFGSTLFNFRADLNEAEKVPIYPDKATLLQTLNDPGLKILYIAYMPNDKENGFYTVAGYELTYKMVVGYRDMFGIKPTIRALELNTTPGQPEPNAIIIWMRGPAAGANQTAVTVNGGLVTVEGLDMTEVNRTYTDLDLAADRLLLAFLWQE